MVSTDSSAMENEADELAEAVAAAGGLAPIYSWLEDCAGSLEASGYSVEELLPAVNEPGIGFSIFEKRDGKTLWQTVGAAARDGICNPKSDVRKQLQTTTHVTAGGLVSTVMISLGLPPAALPIAVALAAVLATVGIQGFCSWSSADPDEPAGA
jgi:hypothetical protein